MMKTYCTVATTVFSERYCSFIWIPHGSTIVTFVTLKSTMTVFNHYERHNIITMYVLDSFIKDFIHLLATMSTQRRITLI